MDKGYKTLMVVLVRKDLRGRGYGTKILSKAKKEFEGIKVFGIPIKRSLVDFYKKLGGREFIADDGKKVYAY